MSYNQSDIQNIVENLGLTFRGIQKSEFVGDMIMFDHQDTRSTLVVKVEDIQDKPRHEVNRIITAILIEHSMEQFPEQYVEKSCRV